MVELYCKMTIGYHPRRGMGAVISTEMRAANNNNGTCRPGEVAPHDPHVGLNGWGSPGRVCH